MLDHPLPDIPQPDRRSLPRPASGIKLLNRERSILAFNRRVLAQAERQDVPLLERLRYITIVSSNLDEFFEVRFADVLQAARANASMGESAFADPALVATSKAAHELIADQYALYNQVVTPALAAHGIRVLNHEDRSEAQREWVAQFFHEQVRPLLTPVALDPSHPLPQVANKSLNFIVQLGGRDAFGRESSIAIVKVPRVLPRVIRLPAEVCAEGEQCFAMLSSVIRAHLDALFLGRPVEAFSQFRLTRDSDLEVDEDDVTNLRQALRRGLTTRHFGQAIRLEVVSSCPEPLWRFLLEQYKLPALCLYQVDGPVNLVRLVQLIDQAADVPGVQLRFTPYEPVWPQGRMPREQSIFETLRQRDVLLHHPFESFDPVVAFLREAATDPDVLAIKQTIYRTGEKSVLMDLLIEAARRGKEVTAVVELKARFDEEANINWAERLEAVGVQVVYGIVGLKTHAKLLVVTRREVGTRGHSRLRRYVHLSTGNYNPKTARLYTDISYLTADAGITADADDIFQQIASLTRVKPPRHLLTAPFVLHRRLLRDLGRVREAAEAGREARVVVKCNALTDPALIQALIACGQAGASIDLIIRGACMLPPGIEGVSERIRVRSIIGRFLEHSRVIYMRWGPEEDDELLLLSSADWMSRNMMGRIELAWPVRDAKLRQRVIDEALTPYLHDSLDAWGLSSDGSYQRLEPAPGAPAVGAQQALMRRFAG